MWRNRSNGEQIITVRITECDDASAAQDQLLEELGTFHSLEDIKRRDGDDSIGDVSFGHTDKDTDTGINIDTVALFAQANVVVTILNAGRQMVSVVTVARAVETLIARDQQNP